MEEDFLTVAEVARKLRVQVYTVRYWIRKGHLIAYKVGRDYRIQKADYEKFLQERRSK